MENFINFFVWYYLVKGENLFRRVTDRFAFMMNKTNTISMVKNFNTPLYQDKSAFGKSLSMFIKFWWIGFGTIYSLLSTIPAFLLFIIFLILPLIPIFQLLNLLI